jgi:hypothetical protein
VASFGSLGSFASAISMVSAGSYQSQGSMLSGHSDGSVLSWQSAHSLRGRRTSDHLDPVVIGSVAVGTALVAGIGWVYARHRFTCGKCGPTLRAQSLTSSSRRQIPWTPGRHIDRWRITGSGHTVGVRGGVRGVQIICRLFVSAHPFTPLQSRAIGAREAVRRSLLVKAWR